MKNLIRKILKEEEGFLDYNPEDWEWMVNEEDILEIIPTLLAKTKYDVKIEGETGCIYLPGMTDSWGQPSPLTCFGRLKQDMWSRGKDPSIYGIDELIEKLHNTSKSTRGASTSQLYPKYRDLFNTLLEKLVEHGYMNSLDAIKSQGSHGRPITNDGLNIYGNN